MPSQKVWKVTKCRLHWCPECSGAVADDVLEEADEGRPEVTPEEALAVGVSWDADEALLGE
eukprot:12039307-Alexandrium_andersonii.AAC.1